MYKIFLLIQIFNNKYSTSFLKVLLEVIAGSCNAIKQYDNYNFH